MRLVIGHRYECKAIEVLPYGAVMEFEDGSTNLLHISNVADEYVKDISTFIQVGKLYTVTAIPGKVKSVEITLRDVDIEPEDDSIYDNIDFGRLLDMYPPTSQDLHNKRDGYRSKKRR